MKLLFEFLPLFVFFIAYIYVDIFFATAAAMVTSCIQVIWSWLKYKKVPRMLWVSFGSFMIFGSLTLILHDRRFIMIKPTIVYWTMGCGFAVYYFVFGKNAIKMAMQAMFEAPDRVWKKWLLSWIAFFVVLGLLNLFVANNFSELTWAKFKVFGALTLTLLLTGLQIWRMMPYMKAEAHEK